MPLLIVVDSVIEADKKFMLSKAVNFHGACADIAPLVGDISAENRRGLFV